MVALQSSGKLVYCFFSITDCAVELQGSHYYPEEYLDMQRLFGLLGPHIKKEEDIRYKDIKKEEEYVNTRTLTFKTSRHEQVFMIKNILPAEVRGA